MRRQGSCTGLLERWRVRGVSERVRRRYPAVCAGIPASRRRLAIHPGATVTQWQAKYM
jgi:hypothetical protein